MGKLAVIFVCGLAAGGGTYAAYKHSDLFTWHRCHGETVCPMDHATPVDPTVATMSVAGPAGLFASTSPVSVATKPALPDCCAGCCMDEPMAPSTGLSAVAGTAVNSAK